MYIAVPISFSESYILWANLDGTYRPLNPHTLYRQTTLALNGLNFEVQGQSGNNVDIQAHKSASPASGMVATFEALVIPGQTISQGTQFATIEVNDKDFAYTLDKDITFAQGTRYTFNLILTSE